MRLLVLILALVAGRSAACGDEPAVAEVEPGPTIRVVAVDVIEANIWVQDKGAEFPQFVFWGRRWSKDDRRYIWTDRGWVRQEHAALLRSGGQWAVHCPDRDMLIVAPEVEFTTTPFDSELARDFHSSLFWP